MPRFPDRSLPVETARSQATRTAFRDMPESDRPRERLRDYGPPQLANAELIAILLRTGTAGESALAAAGRLLARFNGLAGLGRVSYAELCNERGLSDAKACQLLAGLELGRRVAALRPDDRSSISSPADIAALLMPQMSGLEREHLKVVLLNTKNQVLAVHPVYVGSVNAAVVRPAEVFAEAVRRVSGACRRTQPPVWRPCAQHRRRCHHQAVGGGGTHPGYRRAGPHRAWPGEIRQHARTAPGVRLARRHRLGEPPPDQATCHASPAEVRYGFV